MPVLHEPVASPTAALLRYAVLDFKTSERRRIFAPVVHLGEPGVQDVAFRARADEAMDLALRADVVAALLRRRSNPDPAPLVWLTRPGALTLHDVDAAWLAAARAAYAEADVALTMVVVTRGGWWDPRSDIRRQWKRLRQR